ISPCLRGSKCSARPVQALGFGFFRSSACLGGSPVISNLRSRAKPVPRATVFSAPSTDSPARTPRTVGWHSSSVRESVASQIRTSPSSRSTIVCPSSSGASPDRAAAPDSWSKWVRAGWSRPRSCPSLFAPLRLQLQVHLPQDLFPQLLCFQHVPELAHRGLGRHLVTA